MFKNKIFVSMLLTLSLFSIVKAEDYPKKYKKQRLFEIPLGTTEENAIPTFETTVKVKSGNMKEKHGIAEFSVNKNGDIIIRSDTDGKSSKKHTILAVSPEGKIKKRIISDPVKGILPAKGEGFYTFDPATKEYINYDNEGNKKEGAKFNRELIPNEINSGKADDPSIDFVGEKKKFEVIRGAELKKVPANTETGHEFFYVNKNRIIIKKLKQYGLPQDELIVFSGYQGTINGGYPLTIDKNNNIYVFLEGYKSKRDDDVYTSDMLETFIDIFNEKGDLIDEIPIERHDIIVPIPDKEENPIREQKAITGPHSLFITDDGNVYFMRIKTKSREFYKWGMQ